MEAKGIRLQGELGISRKAIAQGMPECSDCTCMLVCAFLCIHCTRDRGCSVHPAFPAPSVFGEGSLSKPRAQCVARMRSHICVGWVERSETHHSPVALMGIASLHPSYEPAIIASEAKQSILSLYREADCFASLANDVDRPPHAGYPASVGYGAPLARRKILRAGGAIGFHRPRSRPCETGFFNPD
jgi:hypothetical protein